MFLLLLLSCRDISYSRIIIYRYKLIAFYKTRGKKEAKVSLLSEGSTHQQETRWRLAVSASTRHSSPQTTLDAMLR